MSSGKGEPAASAPVAGWQLAGGPILCCSFNADCTQLAVSHHGKEIVVYEATSGSASTSGSSSGPGWRRTHTLLGHDMVVSGLDWARSSGLLLSCSHDRNAFVWTPAPPASKAAQAPAGASAGRGGPASSSNGGWEPQMVITKLTKGALCAAWSPSEAKFALGSGARAVSVGFWDPESKWWACKLIRKHSSSVTALAWHPNSVVLATGSTDCKCRLFNAYLQGYEPAHAPGDLPEGSSFGECLVEVAHDGCGWLHGVAWAPGDFSVAYASHDGAVGTVRGPQVDEVVVVLTGLPLKALLAVSERLLVGAGWDGVLVALARSGPGKPWKQAAVLGGSSGAAAQHREQQPQGQGVVKQMAKLGLVAGQGPATPSGLQGHSGCVTQLMLAPAASLAASGLPGLRGAAGSSGSTLVVSAGLDGRLLYWDVTALA